MAASRTGVRVSSCPRVLVDIGRGLDATNQLFVEVCVVLVSAGATGHARVRAKGVACGAPVVRSRACVCRAHKGEPPLGRCLVQQREL